MAGRGKRELKQGEAAVQERANDAGVLIRVLCLATGVNARFSVQLGLQTSWLVPLLRVPWSAVYITATSEWQPNLLLYQTTPNEMKTTHRDDKTQLTVARGLARRLGLATTLSGRSRISLP